MAESKAAAEKYPKLPNADKDESYDKWDEERTYLDFPAPNRIVFAGKPGSGKSYVGHLGLQAALKSALRKHRENDPPNHRPYDRAIAVVPSKKHKEWLIDGGVIIRTSLPPESWFDPKIKTLLIIDDVDPSNWTKDEQHRFNNICKTESSHMNVSVWFMCHQFTDCPTVLRRCASVFFVYHTNDTDSLHTMSRKAGLKKNTFLGIFDKYIDDDKDYVCIDLTPGTPYPIRIGGPVIGHKPLQAKEYES